MTNFIQVQRTSPIFFPLSCLRRFLTIVGGKASQDAYGTQDMTAFRSLYPGYESHPEYHLLMKDFRHVSSILFASTVKHSAALHPYLFTRGGFVRDASLEQVLEFFRGFPSLLTKSAFDAVEDDCVQVVRACMLSRPLDEKELHRNIASSFWEIGSLARKRDLSLRVQVQEGRLNGAAGVICTEDPAKSGIAGYTDMYLPFGSPGHEAKAFFVGEGKFASCSTGMPWQEYSLALATQFWSSFFGHDASAGMIYNVDGIKIFYRTALSDGRYQLYQFPGEAHLFKVEENIETATKFFMEISRVGMTRTEKLSTEELAALRIAVENRDSAGVRGSKVRSRSQETIATNDKKIQIVSAAGETVTFHSLDLESRLGAGGLDELRRAFERSKDFDRMREWDSSSVL